MVQAVAKPGVSSSYERFPQVIIRSHNLVSLHESLDSLAGSGVDELDFSDLLRSSIVLGVAAMDAYYTDVFAERFVPYLKKKGCNPKLAALLESAGLSTEVALNLYHTQRPFRRIRTLVETHLDRHVTQRINVINDLFSTYRIKKLCGNTERKVKRKNLCREVELLVERRHKIVHDGDLNQHGKPTQISGTWVRNRLRDVQKLVGACDEILQHQLG